MIGWLRWLVRRTTPVRLRRWIVKVTRWPPVGGVDFGDLRRPGPISQAFGSERGDPVDRYYIEEFLDRCSADVHGRVLEVGTDRYTRRFGGEGVTRGDVLHVEAGRPGATIIADLTDVDSLPVAEFDCFIFTQTLHFIYDVRAALQGAHRLLKPGGVLLATVSGIAQISRYDADHWGDYWRFTTASARRLVGEVFGDGNVEVEGHGNVLAATAFLYGLAVEELTPAELDHRDEDFDLLITIRATKAT
jgi:SAM-dependent methyltransferase